MPNLSTKTIDRRVGRTRGMLQGALKQLLLEQHYAAITVDDICRHADVARSTFYSHYPDKDALRSAMIGEQLRLLDLANASRLPSAECLFVFSRSLFEHAGEIRSVHRALMANAGDEIHLEARRLVRARVIREIDAWRLDKESPPRAALVEFVVGAFMALLAWWVETESALTPAELDAAFQRMVRCGVGSFGGPKAISGKNAASR